MYLKRKWGYFMFRRPKTKDKSSTENISSADEDKIRAQLHSLPEKQYLKEHMTDKEIQQQLQVRANEVFLIIADTTAKIEPPKKEAYDRFLQGVADAGKMNDPSKKIARFKELISNCDLVVNRFDIRDDVSAKLLALVSSIEKTYSIMHRTSDMRPSYEEAVIPEYIAVDKNSKRNRVLTSSLPNAKSSITLLLNAATKVRSMDSADPDMAKNLYKDLVQLKSDLKKHPLRTSMFGGFIKSGNELNKLIGMVHKLCPPEPKKSFREGITRRFGGK